MQYVSAPVWINIRQEYKTFNYKGNSLHEKYGVFVRSHNYKYWPKHVAGHNKYTVEVA